MAGSPFSGRFRRRLSRRAFLRSSAAAAASLSGAALFEQALERAVAVSPPRQPRLHDIEHVVFLMQENRSFDHYFGTLRGVRGFDDPKVLHDPLGRPIWDQIDPYLVGNPSGRVLPFRLDTRYTGGQCVAGQSHAWAAQQVSWAGGQMNGWVTAHRVGNGNGVETGAYCMGYYTRDDLPFHYALADSFTICDHYFCSVFGPTNPNRIVSMSGTVDPEARRGGPCVDNGQRVGQLGWTSYPERLEKEGISWFIYQEADNFEDNMLPFFRGVAEAPKGSRLDRRANTVIPTPSGQRYGPALAARVRSDVLSGKLPQVSWMLSSAGDSEHPDAAPAAGARFLASVLHALTADPEVWAKTVVFLTYDENDGFFDHVPPPTPPPGTPNEYVHEAVALKNFGATLGLPGPVGLGFRVPMIVISPFSRGGLVCSDVFDHSSMLQFLERRFGVAEPNISPWRRSTTGDLTSTLAGRPPKNLKFPRLPDAHRLARQAEAECTTLPEPTLPANQQVPSQEPGTRPRTHRSHALRI